MNAPVWMLHSASYLRGQLKKSMQNRRVNPWLQHIDGKKTGAGFTLIELVVVIVVICVVFVTAAERFLYWEERAEKAAMESVLAGVKMGLQIRMAELIMTNAQSGLTELNNENPMRWLQEQPTNYAGEYQSPTQPGNWYYESKERELVYAPHSTSHLTTSTNSRELRFRVAIRYDNAGGTDKKSVIGVAMLPAGKFTWFN